MRPRPGAKEWEYVSPNERMPKYNALSDPHLRMHYNTSYVRKHLQKMKKLETMETRNVEAEAKLARRMIIREMYATPQAIGSKGRARSDGTRSPPKARASGQRVSQRAPPAKKDDRAAQKSAEGTASSSSSSAVTSSTHSPASTPRAKDDGSSPHDRSPAPSSPRSVASDSPPPKSDAGGGGEPEAERGGNSPPPEDSDDDDYDDYNDSFEQEEATQKEPLSPASPASPQSPGEGNAKGGEEEEGGRGEVPDLPPEEEDRWFARVREMVQPDLRAKGLSKPAKINDWLYLGDAKAAKNTGALKEIGVTHIVNCAPSMCRTSAATYEGMDVEYHAINAIDEDNYPLIEKHLAEVMEVMQKGRDASGVVFIHCFQGVNRSATLLISSLAKLEQVPLPEVVRQVHAARPVILMGNDGFVRQLIRFAHREGLLQDAA